jgi:DNA-binding transcriptional regulator YiaG
MSKRKRPVIDDDVAFVREARQLLAISQDAFADRLGINRRTVIRWENGQAKLKQRDRLAIDGLMAVRTPKRKAK